MVCQIDFLFSDRINRIERDSIIDYTQELKAVIYLMREESGNDAVKVSPHGNIRSTEKIISARVRAAPRIRNMLILLDED